MRPSASVATSSRCCCRAAGPRIRRRSPRGPRRRSLRSRARPAPPGELPRSRPTRPRATGWSRPPTPSMYERKGRRSQASSLLRRDARSRLEVASNLATRLTELHDPREIAQTVVDELHSAFGYYLAAIHRLDPDARAADRRGDRTADRGRDRLARPASSRSSAGVNGRVARTGERSLVDDTRLDADYVGSGPSLDPGSELSLPIHVGGSRLGRAQPRADRDAQLRRVRRDAGRGGRRADRRGAAPLPARGRDGALVLHDARRAVRRAREQGRLHRRPRRRGRRARRCDRRAARADRAPSSAACATARCCTTSARSGCAPSC